MPIRRELRPLYPPNWREQPARRLPALHTCCTTTRTISRSAGSSTGDAMPLVTPAAHFKPQTSTFALKQGCVRPFVRVFSSEMAGYLGNKAQL